MSVRARGSQGKFCVEGSLGELARKQTGSICRIVPFAVCCAAVGLFALLLTDSQEVTLRSSPLHPVFSLPGPPAPPTSTTCRRAAPSSPPTTPLGKQLQFYFPLHRQEGYVRRARAQVHCLRPSLQEPAAGLLILLAPPTTCSQHGHPLSCCVRCMLLTATLHLFAKQVQHHRCVRLGRSGPRPGLHGPGHPLRLRGRPDPCQPVNGRCHASCAMLSSPTRHSSALALCVTHACWRQVESKLDLGGPCSLVSLGGASGRLWRCEGAV